MIAADVVDAGMRGGVHLQHVHVPRFHDRLAVEAEFRHRDGRAGIGLAGAGVVEAAGEDAGGRGLADAAHAGEHPGLRDAVGRERVAPGCAPWRSWPIRSSKFVGRYLRASTR